MSARRFLPSAPVGPHDGFHDDRTDRREAPRCPRLEHASASDGDSDDDLVARTATGDGAAFTRLVARHRSRLLALATRALHDRAHAEDIVQDVFTRAWVHAPSWRRTDSRRASYAAWLSRVALNLVVDSVRRARPLSLDGIAEPQDFAPLADETMVERERAAHIKAAIAALPERQRLALSLTYDADLSNAESAAAMDISVGAFELLLVRARRALRQSARDA